MKWLLTIFLSLFLFLFFVPQILSTSLGKKIAIQVLKVKTGSNIQIENLQLSWFGPQTLKKLSLQGKEYDASCEELILYTPLWQIGQIKGPVTIVKGKAYFQGPEQVILEDVEAKMEEDHFFSAKGTARQNTQNGSFSVQAKLFDFPSSFSVDLSLSSIPSMLLDRFLDPYLSKLSHEKTKTWVQELAGPWIDLQGSIETKNKEGLFNFSVHAPLCQAKISALFQNNKLSLQKPFEASFTLTPFVNTLLMKKINPLFLTAVQADHPISLYISPENFSCSYDPFKLDDLSIEKGEIDLGKIEVQNGPSLQTILQLLHKSSAQRLQTMQMWCTPLTFQLKNNKLELARLDALLAGSIHLCTWGKINLASRKLQMYLGLPADTLANSFNIPNLHADYVLKIPVRGTIDHPELITGPAVAQITALGASQNLPLPKPGKLFGKALQKALEIKSDGDVPPAKRPFPWEK